MQQRIQLATGNGEIVSGVICTMTQRHLLQIETLWENMLIEAEQADMDWNWDYKLRLATNNDRFEAYVIEQDDLVNGVVLIETQWHRSQVSYGEALSLDDRNPLVYVEYLASAPWNRRSLEDPPFFEGVGTALLSFARQRSVELGYGGRVGLHSLPNSEAFYHRCNMPNYGPDPDKDELVYFEYGTI